MARYMRWTDEDTMRALFLREAGFTNVEIAEQMNKNHSSVSQKLQDIGGNANYILKKSKHKHLRAPVFKFFMEHSWDETRTKFKLTDSELKSIFTVGYRDPALAHLRKDSRTKELWSAKQLVFLLRHAGIRPRKWIAEKLGRGNVNSCIKERLTRLGLSSRTLNGVTTTGYRSAFSKEPRLSIKTDAGPGRGKYSATFFKIVPWVQIQKDLVDGYIETKIEPFIKSIHTMALFQEWIFQGNVIQKMKRSLRS